MTTAVADSSTEVSSSENQILTVDLQCISNAELFVDPKISNFVDVSIDPIRQLCLAADKQVFVIFIVAFVPHCCFYI